jgi:hypothetical protein
VLNVCCAHEQEFVNRILYLIITVLVVLIVRDVYQVAVMRRQTIEKERYVKAVRSSSEAWTTGEMLSAGIQLNFLVFNPLVTVVLRSMRVARQVGNSRSCRAS